MSDNSVRSVNNISSDTEEPIEIPSDSDKSVGSEETWPRLVRRLVDVDNQMTNNIEMMKKKLEEAEKTRIEREGEFRRQLHDAVEENEIMVYELKSAESVNQDIEVELQAAWKKAKKEEELRLKLQAELEILKAEKEERAKGAGTSKDSPSSSRGSRRRSFR